MRRLIDQQLAAWKKSSRRKPLIVRGARQVGKTWSIERFGRMEFEDVAKIDFEKRPDLAPIFHSDLSPLKLLDQLELAIGRKIQLPISYCFTWNLLVTQRNLLV